MTIKTTRSAKISVIGNNPRTFAEMAGAIPDSVMRALNSSQIAELIDANYNLAQKSKEIACRDALQDGGIWDNNRGFFRELQVNV